MTIKRAAACLLACLALLSAVPAGEAAETGPINRRIDPFTANKLDYLPEKARARTDTLVYGVPDLLGVTNPFWAETTGDNYLSSLLYDELVFANNAGENGEGVAAWTVSPNGRTYTFTVREGVCYTDGVQVSSDDYINAIYLILTPGYDGAYDLSRAGIVGAEEYAAGLANTIAGVERIDARSFSVTFETYNPTCLDYLGIPALRVSLFGDMRCPQSATEPEDIAAHQAQALAVARLADATQMTYGQYTLESLEVQSLATLSANPDYWRGAPNIGTVQLQVVPVGEELDAILDGDVDIISMLGSVEAVDKVCDYTSGFINLYTWEGNVIGYLGLDSENPIFADTRVRQALAIGFDRDGARYNTVERYGKVFGMLLFDSFGVNCDMLGEQYPYDMEKASRLLEEAGWLLEADGIRYREGEPLALTFHYNTPNPIMDKVVSLMKADYEALGIDMTVEAVSFEELLARIEARECDMYFQARRLPASPGVSASLFAGESHLNASGYQSDSLQRFLEWAEYESDATRQTVIYEGFYQELYLELPFIPLYRRNDLLLISARVMNATVTTAHDITADTFRFFLTDTLQGQW